MTNPKKTASKTDTLRLTAELRNKKRKIQKEIFPNLII